MISKIATVFLLSYLKKLPYPADGILEIPRLFPKIDSKIFVQRKHARSQLDTGIKLMEAETR